MHTAYTSLPVCPMHPSYLFFYLNLHTGGLYESLDAFMSHTLDSARNTSGINLSGLHRQSRVYRTDTYSISEQAEDGLPLGVFLYKNYRYIVFSFNPVRFVVTVSLTRTAALYLYLVCRQQSIPS